MSAVRQIPIIYFAVFLLMPIWSFVANTVLDPLVIRYSDLIPNRGSVLQLDPITLLATVFQISATLLGLYFAAISLAVNNHYFSGAPTTLSALVTSRLTQSRYIFVLTLIGALSAGQLAWSTVGIPIGSASLFLTVIGSALAIVGFVPLSARTFYLLSPTSSVSILVSELSLNLKDLSALSRGSRNESHIRYVQERVDILIKALTETSRFVLDSQPHHIGVAQMVNMNVLGIHSFYSYYKPLLPDESPWFPLKPRYKSWLTTGGTDLELLISTGAQLPPASQPDLSWLEARLLPVYQESLRAILKSGQTEYLHLANNQLIDVTKDLAARHMVTEANEIILSYSQAVATANSEDSGDSFIQIRQSDSYISSLSLTETAALSAINILIGCMTNALKPSGDDVTEIVGYLSGEKGPFHSPKYLPRTTLNHLAKLKSQLDFEKHIENQLITSNRYLSDIVSTSWRSAYVDEAILAIDFVVDFIFEALVKRDNDGSDHEFILIERGLEAIAKSRTLLEMIRSQDKEARDVEQTKNRHEEPSMLLDRLTVLRKRETEFVTILAKRIGSELTEDGFSNDRPDTFGWGYRTLEQFVWQAMLDQDDERFNMLVPYFFNATIVALTRVRAETEKSDIRMQLAYTSGLISSLASLSGAAALMRCQGNENSWLVVSILWSHFLKKQQDQLAFLRSIILNINYQNDFRTPSAPDTMVMTARKMRIGHLLQSLGILREDFDYGPRTQKKRFQDPLANALSVYSFMSMPELNDLFLAYWIHTSFPKGRNLDEISDMQKRLLDRLEECAQGEDQ